VAENFETQTLRLAEAAGLLVGEGGLEGLRQGDIRHASVRAGAGESSA
jgi:hypothetical protein